MELFSHKFRRIKLSHTVPTYLDSYRITDSKPLYGATPKGEYLFQSFSRKAFQASFFTIRSFDNHKINLLKESRSFFITVQFVNTLEIKYQNLSGGEHNEWAMNFFYSNSLLTEMSLKKSEEYETFFLFVPPPIVKELSEKFPDIETFYNTHTKQEGTDRLFTNNAICSLKVMDMINCFRRDKEKEIKTYIELVNACIELFCKRNLRRQKHIESITIKKIYALKNFLLEAPGEKLHRADLCNKFDLTVYHFEKTFNRVYGITPFAFLRFVAMEKAKELIQTTDLPLKEIAALLGYTYTAFLRAYTAVFKVHPKSHRRKKE